MKIIGFNLSKISAERKEKLESNLQLNQNIDIKDVQKEKIPFATKEEVLKISFSLTLTYSNDLAKLEFSGNVIISPEKDEMKKFLKSWEDKKIPDDLRVALFNFIMHKCNIKALSLEDELSLPYHIQMPRLAPEEDKKSK